MFSSKKKATQLKSRRMAPQKTATNEVVKELLIKGLEAVKQNNFKQANHLFDQALVLQPENVLVYSNKGVIAKKQGNYADAMEHFNKGLSINNNNPVLLSNIGSLLLHLEDFDQAVQFLSLALKHDPKSSNAWNNLGSCYLRQGNYLEAQQAYKNSVDYNANNHEALFNLGWCLLRLGEFQQGFELYESRFHKENNQIKINHVHSPRWLGQSLILSTLSDPLAPISASDSTSNVLDSSQGGKNVPPVDNTDTIGTDTLKHVDKLTQPGAFKEETQSSRATDNDQTTTQHLYISCEQGFGDTIMFVRFIALLLKTGLCTPQALTLRVQTELLALIQRNFPEIHVVSQDHQEPTYSNYHIPLLSLPQLFNIDPFNIPNKTPYLLPSAEKIKKLQKQRHIPSDKKMPVIGISWQGSRTHANDKNRSIAINVFMQMFELISCRLVVLQVDQQSLAELKAWQVEHTNTAHQIIYAGEVISDFDDTATYISQCNLVVSVDTAIAHLAGAMAVDTVTFVPFVHDWRWFRIIQHSPWYPKMRVVRQRTNGHWASEIQEGQQILQQYFKA